MIEIELTDGVIDGGRLTEFVRDADCGAVVTFLGTVRGLTGTRVTTSIHYEAYPAMARRVLHRLAQEARSRFGIGRVAIVHRLGLLTVGEASIGIALSSPHRARTFEAVAWLMDSIKQSVPIWKRETDADGRSDWVHPGAETV